MEFAFTPIGTISSCFKEKFGIPRQPRLVPQARAVLTLENLSEVRKAVQGLEGFSHVWVVFVFHALPRRMWKPLIRPPRLGGARKVGVFATRSPHRPNPIGISAVELERVDTSGGRARLHLKGIDFLDGTPVLDIKPYVAYADSIRSARGGWADSKSRPLAVSFSREADRYCRRAGGNLKTLIRQILRLDPRPGFQRRGSGSYAMRLLDFDVDWTMRGGRCLVRSIRNPRF